MWLKNKSSKLKFLQTRTSLSCFSNIPLTTINLQRVNIILLYNHIVIITILQLSNLIATDASAIKPNVVTLACLRAFSSNHQIIALQLISYHWSLPMPPLKHRQSSCFLMILDGIDLRHEMSYRLLRKSVHSYHEQYSKPHQDLR